MESTTELGMRLRESGGLNPPALLAYLHYGLLASPEGLAGWDPRCACWSLGLGYQDELG